MSTLILTCSDVAALLEPLPLLDAIRDGFIAAAGATISPQRARSALPGSGASATVLFPGLLLGANLTGIPAYSVKVHAKFPGETPAIRGLGVDGPGGRVGGVPKSFGRWRGAAGRLSGVTPEMKRVAIIGSGGAGKTTLARELGAKTGIPVIHLDRLYWSAGWVPTPREGWLERQREVLVQERWIMDGNYGSTMTLRLEAADTVIFLDTPRLRCLWRVLKRQLIYRNRTRPDMAEDCPERLTSEFLRYLWDYPNTRRPVILETLERLNDKRIVRLRGDRAVAQFLARVGQQS